jgi:HSP20 family protein
VDVYQTPTDIIIQTIVAGIKPDDLDVTLTQDMVTIKGKREDSRRLEKENFFYQELYWGSFSRSILLPQEVDPDEAEATLKNGLLTIKLPKLDKERVQKIKIKGE